MNLKTFAAALLVGVSSTAAMAADLPSRRPAPVPVVEAAPIFTWTGFYVGAQAGYAWDRVSVDNNLFFPFAFGGLAAVSRNGFIGGGHVGYLLQTGPVVYGLEGDVEGASIKNSGLRASLRGRLGLAMDRALFYVTGGLAYAHSSYPFNTLFGTSTYSNDRLGWTLGGGLEYAFAPNWSARVEYRYSDFGRANVNNLFTNVAVRRTEQAVRVGVSYHFGGAPAPVVAKY